MKTCLSKIGVIGDVHAKDAELKALLEFLTSRELDQLFCVGDVTDGTGSVERCCELLAAHHVLTVRGNHDEWCLENSNRLVEHATILTSLGTQAQSFLASLPSTLVVETVDGQVMICHGLGEYNMAGVRPTDTQDDFFRNLELRAIHREGDVRIVINGHTHRPGIHQFDHLVVINCGSLDQPQDGCAVIADFEHRTVDFFHVDGMFNIEHCRTSEIPPGGDAN